MKKKYIGVLCLILVGIIALDRSTNVAMSPNDYVSLGNQMGMKGDHVGASKFFKNSMKIDPYHIPAYLGLGIAYGNLGKDEDAIEVFKEGIKLDNVHNFTPQMQIGIAAIAYDKMNNRKIAVKYVKKALQMYTDQGNYAGVAMAAQKLKQISPDS